MWFPFARMITIHVLRIASWLLPPARRGRGDQSGRTGSGSYMYDMCMGCGSTQNTRSIHWMMRFYPFPMKSDGSASRASITVKVRHQLLTIPLLFDNYSRPTLYILYHLPKFHLFVISVLLGKRHQTTSHKNTWSTTANVAHTQTRRLGNVAPSPSTC